MKKSLDSEMVNNSTDINKMNDNSSLQIIEHIETSQMTLNTQVLSWDRHNTVAGLNRIMGSHPILLIPYDKISSKFTVYLYT